MAPDREAAYRVVLGVRTGMFSHNIFRIDPSLPFGGFKQSGLGRDGGKAELTSFTETEATPLDQPA
jgi:aldehyde dehydrogenase (NAD+)